MLYITTYSVIGSRCTGTYLVNANSKREANSIVKAIDPDYTRFKSYTRKEFEKDWMDWEDMVEDAKEPSLGKAVQLECGT